MSRRRRRAVAPTKVVKRRPDEIPPFQVLFKDLQAIHLSQNDVHQLLTFLFEHYNGEHRYWNRIVRDKELPFF